MEKFWASLLIIPIFMWYSFNFALDRDFKIRQQLVENTVYQYTQVAAKKGKLYTSVYDELEQKLNRLGSFDISVSAEKFQAGNDTPVVITDSEVIDRDLREEGYDIINIYVRSRNRHPLSRLYEITPFGSYTGTSCDIRLFGKASVYIQ